MQTTPRVYPRPSGCTEVSLPCKYGCVQVKKLDSQHSKNLIGLANTAANDRAVQTNPIPVKRTKNSIEKACTAVDTAMQTSPIPVTRHKQPKNFLFIDRCCQTMSISTSSVGTQTRIPIVEKRILGGMDKQCQTVQGTSAGTLFCNLSKYDSFDQLVEPLVKRLCLKSAH